jgi:hypothetical protein
MGGEGMYTGFWLGNLREGDPDVDGKIILRWIFNSGALVPTLLQWKSNNYYVF